MRNFKILGLTLVVTIVSLSNSRKVSGVESQVQKTAVHGSIRSASGTPISSAYIRVQDWRPKYRGNLPDGFEPFQAADAFTQQNGTYQLEISPGYYDICFRSPEHTPQWRQLRVS